MFVKIFVAVFFYFISSAYSYEIIDRIDKNIKKVNGEDIKMFDIRNDGIYKINCIKIEGVDDVLNENIYQALTFKNGDYVNFKNNTISNNFNRIKKFFKSIEDITLECSKMDNDELILIFKIKEYECIKKIEIIGSKQKKFNDEINNIVVGRFVEKNVIDGIKKKIIRKFGSRGEFSIETKSGKILRYGVDSDRKRGDLYVNKIFFIGNNNLKANDLLKILTIKGVYGFNLGKNLLSVFNNKINNFNIMKTVNNLKKSFLIVDSIYFDKKKIDEDVKNILNLYFENGYLDANVKKIEIDKDSRTNICNIKYFIEEGAQYFVNEVEIVGNKSINSDILMEILDVKTGDVFNYNKIQNKISENLMENSNIKNLYAGLLGFLKCSIKVSIRSIKNNKVNFAILIDEGEKCRINKIKINGNKFTKSTIFYRYSYLYPGDIYNGDKYIKTQQSMRKNEFVDNKKTFVTLDNDSNLRVMLEERLGFEPVFHASLQKVEKNQCCCNCCSVAPFITLGVKCTNLNLAKLFHFGDKRFSFLGNGDTGSFNLIYEPGKNKINALLSFTVREILRNLTGGISIAYSSFKGNIDNEIDKFHVVEGISTNKKGYCKSVVNEINISSKISYFNFKGTHFGIMKPLILDVTFGKNATNVYKSYFDIPFEVGFKYISRSNSFWIVEGIEYGILLTTTWPFLLPIPQEKHRRCKLKKYIRITCDFNYYRNIYRKFVFYFSSFVGYCRSFKNDISNYFMIKKEDSNTVEIEGTDNITYLSLKGINEANSYLRKLNKSVCNLASKLNFELRYLLIESFLLNTYAFVYFNGGNLFIGQSKKFYNSIKRTGRSQWSIYSPVRFFSYGIGVRFEIELLKIMIPFLSFSFYYDLRYKQFSFDIIRLLF